MDWHTRFVQQSRWTSELRSYLFRRAGIETADRILEVGCGTGAILMDIFTTFFHSRSEGRKLEIEIHGLDINSGFLSQATQNIPEARLTLGDAHSLPYTTSSFDLVFCHFLLMWVVDPHQVIGEMVRVTRPGGFVLALAEPDYGGRIDYPDALAELGVQQEVALMSKGADTRLGRRLRGLFHRSGLQRVEAGIMGGEWKSNQLAEEQNQEWEVLKSDLNGMDITKNFDRLRQLDAISWQRDERILFVPTFYAWGRK
jgi:ubiquinone/menaquinone biosynthesis C-methylase UbiE